MKNKKEKTPITDYFQKCPVATGLTPVLDLETHLSCLFSFLLQPDSKPITCLLAKDPKAFHNKLKFEVTKVNLLHQKRVINMTRDRGKKKTTFLLVLI